MGATKVAETHVKMTNGPSNTTVTHHNPDSAGGSNAQVEGTASDSTTKKISGVSHKNPA